MNEHQKAELEQAGELINNALAEDATQAPAEDAPSIEDLTGRGQPFQPSDGE